MRRQRCKGGVCFYFGHWETGKAKADDEAGARTPADRGLYEYAEEDMMLKCFLYAYFFERREFVSMLQKVFRLTENKTTVRTEINAGLATFFAMAYIIFVNPIILSSTGMPEDGIMIATCLSAALGTLLCAFLSNQPYAMASGMGLNTFFAYTLCGIYGYSWQQALALTLFGGVIFLVVTLSPIRDRVIASIPENLKHAISAGIGLFIALIGLLNAGLIKMEDGFPALGDLKSPSSMTALLGLLITAILVIRNVKGNIFLGMIATVLISLITGEGTLPGQVISLPGSISKVFLKMDFSGLLQGEGIRAIASLLTVLFSLAMVDMFDTLGFLIGASSEKRDEGTFSLDKDMGRVMIADAGGTIIGALSGTSTVTTFAESAVGVSAGGRTGLTAATTAVCFLLAMFFAPLTGLFSAAAAAPALIIVGLYLLMDIQKVDFTDMSEAIPAFLTVLVMPFSYSITDGIGAGFISYVLCRLAKGKAREISPTLWIASAIFLIYFLL